MSYYNRVSEWRKAVRLSETTVAEIARNEGLPITTVDSIVYGDRYPSKVSGEAPCVRRNPGKTIKKLTPDEVRTLRSGGQIDTKISKATKSKVINRLTYKGIE